MTVASKDKARNAETLLGRSLNERGLLMKREFRDFGDIKTTYAGVLSVKTLVISFPKSDSSKKIYGVKVEQEETNGYDESAFLDFDELEELLRAMKYLYEVAGSDHESGSDYTELQYSTKGEVVVGFYRTTDGMIHSYFDVEPGGEMLFLSQPQFREIFSAIKHAYSYLVELGAE